MLTKFSPDELALGLELIMVKNRDSLSLTEINLLAEAIHLIRQFNNPKVIHDRKSMIKIANQIILNLLKLFGSYELIKELIILL